MTGRADFRSTAAPRRAAHRRRDAGFRRTARGRQRRGARGGGAERRDGGRERARIALPAVLGEAWTIHQTLQDYEAQAGARLGVRDASRPVAPLLRKLLDEAQAIEPRRYDEARRTARRARGALGEIFGDVDVLLTFSAPGAAPEAEGAPATPASTASGR